MLWISIDLVLFVTVASLDILTAFRTRFVVDPFVHFAINDVILFYHRLSPIIDLPYNETVSGFDLAGMVYSMPALFYRLDLYGICSTSDAAPATDTLSSRR